MYESFYGLRERPFDLTPSPRFLVLTPRHREALSNLYFALSSGKGVTVLLGEAGTGKTTLLRAVLDAQAKSDALCVHINNPTLTRAEFVQVLAEGFGLSAEARESKVTMLRELEALLHERKAAGRVSVVFIDEAQSLPRDLLEEVRLLANLETTEHKLLSVVLAGQPELAQRLNETGLRQLKQRVALRCELGPLSVAETAAYIARRISIAGGQGEIFTPDVIGMIHRASAGIPRVVSVICDNALVSGFALGQKPIGRQVIAEVCRDFDLSTGVSMEPTPVADKTLARVAVPPGVAASSDVNIQEPPPQSAAWFGLLRRRRVS
jgi:general secretion pathway protein A